MVSSSFSKSGISNKPPYSTHSVSRCLDFSQVHALRAAPESAGRVFESAAMDNLLGAVPDPLVLAIDQGTHASRALVFDRRGRALSSGTAPVSITYPQADWAEQDGCLLYTSDAADE